jgi:hypothetical protein
MEELRKSIISELTEEELLTLIADCKAEMANRKNQQMKKLTDDFKKAFQALIDNNIVVRFTSAEEDIYRVLVENAYQFDFTLI